MRLMAFMNAEKQRRRKSSSSCHPAEVEDADRKIKDYLLRLHLSLWHPISTAPANHDLESKVLDRASSIILPFPCRRTTAGEWINADLETSIDIRPTKCVHGKRQKRVSYCLTPEATFLIKTSSGGAIHE